jgi:hypothetical protein
MPAPVMVDTAAVAHISQVLCSLTCLAFLKGFTVAVMTGMLTCIYAELNESDSSCIP